MANDVINILKVTGDESRVKLLFNNVRGDDEQLFDFNKIKPMPESLAIESGTRTDRGLKYYSEYIASQHKAGYQNGDLPARTEEEYLSKHPEIKKDEWELGKQAFDNINKYGVPTWYEWSINNWGTKWSAYGEVMVSEDTVSFYTAWSCCLPLITQLSKMYPDLEFQLRWADEDLGYNLGETKIKNGIGYDLNLPKNGSREAFELSADIWEYNLSEMGFKLNEQTNTYEYRDFDDEPNIDMK